MNYNETLYDVLWADDQRVTTSIKKLETAIKKLQNTPVPNPPKTWVTYSDVVKNLGKSLSEWQTAQALQTVSYPRAYGKSTRIEALIRRRYGEQALQYFLANTETSAQTMAETIDEIEEIVAQIATTNHE